MGQYAGELTNAPHYAFLSHQADILREIRAFVASLTLGHAVAL